MKLLCQALALLLVLVASARANVLAAPVNSPTLKNNSGTEGVRLLQNSQIYGSGLVFKASKNGFSWSNPCNGVTVLSSAPDWRVYLYNTNTHHYFQTTLDKYEGYMLRASIIFWGFSFPRIPYKEENSQYIRGLKCRTFVMPKMTFKEKLKNGIDTLLDSKLITTNDLPVGAQATAFVRKHYNFPPCGDMPVSMFVQRKDKSRQYMLQTREVSKASYLPSEFKLPEGAKRVWNEKEIIRGQAEDNSLDGLLKDIDRKSFLD